MRSCNERFRFKYDLKKKQLSANGTEMGITKTYLGWDKPALHAAADWLFKTFGSDMSNVQIAVPGAEAGRRLIEILGRNEATPLLAVPGVATLGQLLETYYVSEKPVCPPLTSLLVRAWVTRQASQTEEFTALLPKLPDADDWSGWLAVARDLQQLDDQLAADCKQAGDVLAMLQSSENFAQLERWEVIAHLQQIYEAALADHSLHDRNTARADALARQTIACDKQLVLLAVTDINGVMHRFVERIAEQTQVHVLLNAPESLSGRFDSLGSFTVDQWIDQPVQLDEQQVVYTPAPMDQIHHILSRLQQYQPVKVNEITIGLGDEALGPAAARMMKMARVPARIAAGNPLASTSPALLLQALRRYIDNPGHAELASLVRHTTVESKLQSALAINSIVTCLDTFAANHLAAKPSDLPAQQDEGVDQIRQLKAAMDQLLQSHLEEPATIQAHAVGTRALLRELFEEVILDAHSEADEPQIVSLRRIGQVLSRIEQLHLPADCAPQLSIVEWLDLLLSELQNESIPDEFSHAAIQLAGWLELPLDDAPNLYITNVNEGSIPTGRRSDPYLPDSLRKQLGLPDDRHRMARDTMLLNTLLQSRPSVTLLCTRTGMKGDPLPPSRLLLKRDIKDVATTLLSYADDEATQNNRPILRAGDVNRFEVPPPPPNEPLAELRVTAFRDYIACPYRFYLKHVLKLQPIGAEPVEMDALLFGTMAHTVLALFGRSSLGTSDNPVAISEFLHATLDDEIAKQHGPHPKAAVRIQTEWLKYRFDFFSHWQAAQVRNGWRIITEQIEASHRQLINVDGTNFAVKGTIDRIDEHPEHGIRIIDYKTSEQGNGPDKTHRDKDGNWLDLQLPLYRELAADVIADRDLSLGYVLLPKDVTKVGYAAGEWSNADLDDAKQQAVDIVRQIRDGIFWPPADPAAFPDGFELLCHDPALLYRPPEGQA